MSTSPSSVLNEIRGRSRSLFGKVNDFGAYLVRTRWRRLGLSAFGVVFFVTTWELLTASFGVIPSYIFPSVSGVVETFLDQRSLILDNLWFTLRAGLLGFLIALSLSIVVAVPLVISDEAKNALMPIIVGTNTVPRVTLAPLLLFYIDITTYANIMIAAWVAFFPMFVNTSDGLGSLPDETENLLNVVGASTWQEFRYARFPNALPNIFDGMKVGISLSIIGAIVGEFVARDRGLGFLAFLGLRYLDLELVLASIIVLGLFTTVMIFGMYLLQDRIVFWQEASFFASE